MKTEINDIEMYFQWWLEEMKDAGYIEDWKREPETLLVASTIPYGRIKRFKRKEKEVEKFNLFPEIKYTYDYWIRWTSKAEYLFYEVINEEMTFEFGKPLFVAHAVSPDEVISFIDVKPTNNVVRAGGKVSSSISFPYKQRLLWEKSKIFVNKVIPIPMSGGGFKNALFVRSFVPNRFLITNKSGAARKINFPYVNLSKFVNDRSTYLTNLIENTNND